MRYEIAVLHASSGRGGSTRMHSLDIDDRVIAYGPINAFPLVVEAEEHLLLAGGIGITPLLCMARTLKSRGASMAIHYVARSPARMAFREELAGLGARLYFDEGDPHRGLPLRALLAEPRPARHLYVCGPAPMIAAAIETATTLGWPASHLHHESFGGAIGLVGDRPIRLHLHASRRTVEVAADESILDALLREGFDPLHDCRRGECGLCVTDVIDGVPEHRDHVLSVREHAGGKVMCTCVSRARTDELTLDL
jgi:vanillate O-demethylase ferredoxin subunit